METVINHSAKHTDILTPTLRIKFRSEANNIRKKEFGVLHPNKLLNAHLRLHALLKDIH